MPRIKYLKNSVKALTKPHCGVLCLDCGWLGVSWSLHDYKTCSCQNQAMVDGGFDYTRAGAKSLKRIQYLSISPMPEAK